MTFNNWIDTFISEKGISLSKIIEVDSGMTIWYGRSHVNTKRDNYNRLVSSFGFDEQRPDKLHSGAVIQEMSNCITREVLADRVVP